MKKLGWEATRDLLLLSVVAGSADAAGFMSVGHVFTSNMTGNLVLLGLASGQGQWADVVRTLYVIGLFAIGAAFGSRIARRFSDSAWRRLMTRLLTAEVVLLFGFAIYWAFISEAGREAQFFGLVPLLTVAMGLQSAAMNRLTIAGVTNTAMTGTLVSFVVGLEGLLFRRSAAQPEARSRAKKQFLAILLYCGGAAVEGVLTWRAVWAIGFLPACGALWVVVAHRRDCAVGAGIGSDADSKSR